MLNPLSPVNDTPLRTALRRLTAIALMALLGMAITSSAYATDEDSPDASGARTSAPATTPGGSARPKAYVGIFKDNTVAVLDTATRRVIKTIPVPPGPHGLAITRDGKKVYVSSDGASTVSVIDTAKDEVVGAIDVGPTPHGLALTPDGRRLLVAVFGADRLVVVDTESDRVEKRISVLKPHNVAVSPDGRMAFVASQPPNAAAVAILDLRGGAPARTVPLPKAPRALNFGKSGKALYFTEAGVNALQVLDPRSGKVVRSIPVGASPHHPLFTANGEYGLVVSQGPGELAILDGSGRKVIGKVAVGKLPHWIASSADGDTAFVTNEGSDDVSVVDVEKQRLVATIPVGHGPRKIVLQPEPNKDDDHRRESKASRAPATQAAAATVRIEGFEFEPPTLRVSAGHPVVWTNADAVPHAIHADGGAFASETLTPGASYRTALLKPGSYAYACAIHPHMRGSIIVTP